MNDYRAEYNKWISEDVFDKATKDELKSINDEKEIEDRFYKNLAFGTGGLRGVIGAGTNRMNFYTVGKATQGLADFINSRVTGGSVAVAYDSRRMSKEFALDTALILAANKIKAYLFCGLRPTPELSFAVRHLKTTAGVVITASHNPPEYNGYKVYFSDGAQIVAPYDKLIIDSVSAVKDYSAIKRTDEDTALKSGYLQYIGEEIDDAYIAAIKKSAVNPEIIKEQADKIKIVYSPLNGTGKEPVMRALKELGFKNVSLVPEQAEPDGNFPTLKYPNPEDPAAFTYALELAAKTGADIVMATDPDADRLGVYALGKNGEYIPFTGNMSGLLLAEYELSERKKKGLLPNEPQNAALVTTIVSSDMAREIAKKYGVTFIEVLTGFKYIGEQIKLFEEAKSANGGVLSKEKGALEYVFGFEESYGSLLGTHARDKDAVAAVAALAEAAAFYKAQGLTLCDVMENIYREYGYYKEGLSSTTLSGADGSAKIKAITRELRNNPPCEIGGFKVLSARDYASGEIRNLVSGDISETELPASDVLYYELENGWCCVRPSGTEPKIKYYYGVKGVSRSDAEDKLSALKAGLLELSGNI